MASSASGQCIICAAISRMISTPLHEDFSCFIDINETRDPLSWNCPLHLPVLEASNIFDNGLVTRGRVSLIKLAGQAVFTVDNTRLHLVRGQGDGSNEDEKSGIGMGRIVGDSEWIDLNVLRGFVDNCRTRHGALCDEYPFGNSQTKLVASRRPAYLVDVTSGRVIDTATVAPNAVYVTLSYVRGSDAQDDGYLSLTTLNRNELQQPGNLSATAHLPRTIADAMHLAALLGIHYIWIDRLCILQDDPIHRAQEESKVGFIAAGAAFAIAECDGLGPSHGIRGVRELPNPQPRSFVQKVFPFGGDGAAFIRSTGALRDFRVDTHAARVAAAAYPFRAQPWAETALARRVMRFELGTVQWVCRSYPMWAGQEARRQDEQHMWEDCAHWCDAERWGCQMDVPRGVEGDIDDGNDDDEDEDVITAAQPHWTTVLDRPWPSPAVYYAMLVELTQRRASGPPGEDMLAISAGLASAVGAHFQGRIACGLPETFFDLALLWRIPANSKRLRDAWPSWSWAGWARLDDEKYQWGLLHAPEMDGADHVVSKLFAGVEIIPIVEWSVGERPDTPVESRVVLNSRHWSEAREIYQRHDAQSSSADLPVGWTCVRQAKIDVLARTGAPKGYEEKNDVFRYNSATTPSAPRKSFWYPIPMYDPNDEDNNEKGHPQIVNDSSRYLFGKVPLSRHQFFIHRADWPPYSSHTTPPNPFVKHVTGQGNRSQPGTHALRDARGQPVGVLDVHDPDHGSLLHGAAAPERTPLELAALSRGRTRQLNGPFAECEARPEWRDVRNRGWYEFYNVAWVTWAEDMSGKKVALRKGLGRVSKEAWEAAVTEEVEVVFG